MEKNCIEQLIATYLNARSVVTNSGFSCEVDWQDSACFDDLSESTFLRESAWVVLSSGMKETVVRKKFIELTPVFFHWRSASEIIRDKSNCHNKALQIFNNEPKINAIYSIARKIDKFGFEKIRTRILKEGISYLMSFDYIGPVTAFHLAKNIGLDVVKPDRHLKRIAEALQFDNPTSLCMLISSITGDKLSVVDIVLWRFATINKGYINLFKSLIPIG
jgi:hypothetical protein